MSKEANLSYAVVVYRRDGVNLLVYKDEDFQKCKSLWQGLKEQWITAHKESIPFVLEDADIVCDMTCFEPGLINEIKLEAVVGNAMSDMEGNPYAKRMMQQGLGNVLSKQQGVDLLDGGFKY